MSYKFKIDDRDSLEIVKGEDREIVLRLMDEFYNPINLTDADIFLELPKADGVGIIKRSNLKMTFTPDKVSVSADTITIEDHGLVDDDVFQLIKAGSQGASLPGNLAASTPYYAKVIDKDTIQVAASAGGTAVNISSTGVGTHTVDFAPIEFVDNDGNDEILGKMTLTLSDACTNALKIGEKQNIELSYVIAGITRIVQLSKVLTVFEQSL
jgi:hypothetical protein